MLSNKKEIKKQIKNRMNSRNNIRTGRTPAKKKLSRNENIRKPFKGLGPKIFLCYNIKF